MNNIQQRRIQHISLVNLQIYPSRITKYYHSQKYFSHKGTMAKLLVRESKQNV